MSHSAELLKRYEESACSAAGTAVCLPFATYRDPAVFRFEARNLFRDEWVFVCTEAELPEAGDYLALNLAGEPVIVLRGRDGTLRALSNNCRHRGTPLLDDGFGKAGKLLICPYHAWSYDHQGNLKAAPFTAAEELEKSTHCLPAYRLETVMGLVFVNLSDQPSPLAERLSRIDDYAAVYAPRRFRSALPGTTETWRANWKLAMENAMESYHLFKVHRETLDPITPTRQAYPVAGSSEWTLTGGEMVHQTGAFMRWLQGDYPKAYDHYLLISIPPNFVGIMTCDSFDWLTVLPIDAENSLVRSGSLAEPGAGDESKVGQALTDAFFAEDKQICERVQQGMNSRLAAGGTLVAAEKPVIDFHHFLASRLFGAAKTPLTENPDCVFAQS